MAAPAPTPPMTPRRIAFRQGLLFGGILGVAALVLNMCLIFVPFAGRVGLGFSPVSLSSSSNVLVYLIGLVVFFFAGWRAAQQTGRVDIGGLAGFWAGLVGGLVLLAIDLVLLFYSLTSIGSVNTTSLTMLIVYLIFLSGRDAILALLFGAGLGVLGGFIGRTYATSGPAAAQPNPPPAAPPPAAAPQPPASPQSQP